MEKWIDDALSKKLLVRNTVFYLGTAYEATRVKDERLEKILAEKKIQVEKEFIYIHADLLADQQKVIEIMEEPAVQSQDSKLIESKLVAHFKKIDRDNIGVITHPQFVKLVSNIGIKLSPAEEKELLKKVDPEESGMIEFLSYKEVVQEMF